MPGLLAAVYPDAFDECGKVKQSAYRMPGHDYIWYAIRPLRNTDEYGEMGSPARLLPTASRRYRKKLRIARKYCVWRDTGLFRDPEYIRATVRREIVYSYLNSSLPAFDAMDDEEILRNFSEHVRPKRAQRWRGPRSCTGVFRFNSLRGDLEIRT